MTSAADAACLSTVTAISLPWEPRHGTCVWPHARPGVVAWGRKTRKAARQPPEPQVRWNRHARELRYPIANQVRARPNRERAFGGKMLYRNRARATGQAAG